MAGIVPDSSVQFCSVPLTIWPDHTRAAAHGIRNGYRTGKVGFTEHGPT